MITLWFVIPFGIAVGWFVLGMLMGGLDGGDTDVDMDDGHVWQEDIAINWLQKMDDDSGDKNSN